MKDGLHIALVFAGVVVFFSAFIHGGDLERKKMYLSLRRGFAKLQDGICVALDCTSNRRQ
jgi:hypothetical protein